MGKFDELSGKKSLNAETSSSVSSDDTITRNVPIPLNLVIEIEVVFERRIDEAERDWLFDWHIDILNNCWHGLLAAIAKVNPRAICSARIATSSHEANKSSIKKAHGLHANLVTQPTAVMLPHPSRGQEKYEVTLNAYLQSKTSQQTVVLVAPNHRVVPG